MAASLLGVELDNGGVLIRFVQTAVETQGTLHAQEARYRPHSPVPPYHCHPRQDEHFSIVQGALRFRVEGQERVVQSGEQIDIPKGHFHLVHNPHDEPAVVLWETRPALHTAEFFVDMNRAHRGGARPPLKEAAAILSEYRDCFVLAKPPPFVQRLFFGCLAPFGRHAVGRWRHSLCEH